MIRHIVDSRSYLSLILTVGIGTLLSQRFPFPEDNAVLQLVAAEKLAIFNAIRCAYETMLYSTPFIGCSMLFSILYIFFVRPREVVVLSSLPPYPKVTERERLFLVLGELHHPKRPVPVEQPQWLTIPDQGLFTGVAIFGAIGSGKTSCCMHPFAEQILAYRAGDAERRAAGLVLEVKGDFCHKVRKILKKYDREHDYFEISLDCPYRYNPLHNDLEAYALAYGIARLLNNLFGRGKEPFWQQAYTNLVKFIILLHKVNYDYVTLFDVYECAINPDKLELKITEGERLFQTKEYVLVPDGEYIARRELVKFGFDRDTSTGEMKAGISVELLRHLDILACDPRAGRRGGAAVGGVPGAEFAGETNRRSISLGLRWRPVAKAKRFQPIFAAHAVAQARRRARTGLAWKQPAVMTSANRPCGACFRPLLQPHRTRSFKLSTDPFFLEKVRDIVGLYLNPPDHAPVFCQR